MRKLSLVFQMFVSILLVALGAVLAVGLIARDALARAFDEYLATLPTPEGGMHMGRGRAMLGAAEQTFVATVDQSVYIGAFVAIAIAAVAALLLARYLSRPMRQLETAAENLAAGDLTHRVEIAGPAEVAALGNAFNSMADSLEEAEILRRRLVADVAHELRNPIAAARAQAEGMAEGVLTTDTARLDSLVEDLQHLTVLVDDLQELAVAEAGRLHYEMSPVDLTALVAREAERATAGAPPGVSVTWTVPDVELLVNADERRLSQVLRNLLANALRHTASGNGLGNARAGRRDGPALRCPTPVKASRRRTCRTSSSASTARMPLAPRTREAPDSVWPSREPSSKTTRGEMFAQSVLGEGATVGFILPLSSE